MPDPLGTVCLFFKALRPRQVKTRLASRLGDALALRLARAFVEDSLLGLRRLPWAHVALATTGRPAALALQPGEEVWLQGGGDLGARVERVLRRALRKGGFALAVGADSPGLPSRLYEDARRALSVADAVLGPAEDGGFYLLGLKRCPRGLLRALPWSREDTFRRTLERLRERGMTVAVLEPWFDVDRPEDLCRLARLISRGEVRAPATALALEEVPRRNRATIKPKAR